MFKIEQPRHDRSLTVSRVLEEFHCSDFDHDIELSQATRNSLQSWIKLNREMTVTSENQSTPPGSPSLLKGYLVVALGVAIAMIALGYGYATTSGF
jgi:hypothetical protein